MSLFPVYWYLGPALITMTLYVVLGFTQSKFKTKDQLFSHGVFIGIASLGVVAALEFFLISLELADFESCCKALPPEYQICCAGYPREFSLILPFLLLGLFFSAGYRVVKDFYSLYTGS
jgi:hypothetical protein